MDNSATNGVTQDLQTRLNDPQTVAALTRLLDRAETLATAVEAAEGILQQGPGLVSVFTDSVDEVYSQALASGTDLEIVLQHGLQVATKLQNPRLIKVLTKMLDQTDSLEMVVGMLEQGPGVVAMMADSLDEIVDRAAKSGVDPELLLHNGLQVAAKLQNPRLIQALTQLLDQTESLEMLASLAEQGPGVMAMMADSLDEMAQQAAEAGVELDVLLPELLKIGAKLQNPKMLATLNRALDQTETLDMMVSMMEQGPGVAAMMADSLDEMVRQAAESGVDLERILPKVLNATLRLVSVVESGEFDALLDSGVLDPKTVQVVGNAGKALSQSYQPPPEPVGLFGLLKALNDPDMQRAMGFLTNFAKQFGRELT